MAQGKQYKREKVIVEIKYLLPEKDQQGKIKISGVDISTSLLSDELNLMITQDTELDWETDEIVENGKYRLNLRGTKQAYYELGKLLLTLTRYSEQDPNYYIHLDDIKGKDKFELTHLIIHVPKK